MEPETRICIFDMPILKQEVATAIRSLVKRKAAPPRGIKAGIESISGPLTTLFNSMVKDICTPQEWREEKLILLSKAGSYLLLDNFQGISISDCLGNVLGKVIAKRLIRAAEDADIWGEIQGSGRLGR